jgi:uncharacterized protein (DUF983 family)
MTGPTQFAPVWRVALFGRCPRCGDGKLYRSYLKVAAACNVCGLDLTKSDSGDGPAVFVIFIVGALSGVFSLWLQLTFNPPLWLFMTVLIGLIAGLSLLLLPVFKGVLIALQYRNAAGEGRREDE